MIIKIELADDDKKESTECTAAITQMKIEI
jgi:hypothetical protein